MGNVTLESVRACICVCVYERSTGVREQRAMRLLSRRLQESCKAGNNHFRAGDSRDSAVKKLTSAKD